MPSQGASMLRCRVATAVANVFNNSLLAITRKFEQVSIILHELKIKKNMGRPSQNGAGGDGKQQYFVRCLIHAINQLGIDQFMMKVH